MVLRVQVGAVVQHGNVGIDRHGHQDAAVALTTVGLRVPEHRVVEGENLRVQLEAGVDLGQRFQEPAGVELNEVLHLEDQQPVRTLSGPDGGAFFRQEAVERADLEVNGVTGLLLVLVHDVMKARKPGRLRCGDGDRRLSAEGDRRQAGEQTGGEQFQHRPGSPRFHCFRFIVSG